MKTKGMVMITSITAVLALCLSIFNLYWNSFRKRRALTLIATNVWTDYSADFILANGSNCDLFLIKAIWSFRGTDKTASLIPRQQCVSHDTNPGFVPAGKATAFKLKVLEKLDEKDLAEGGKDEHTSWNLHMFDLKLDVYWVEPSGKEYQAECIFGRYGITDECEVRTAQEVHRNFSLYDRKVEIPVGGRPSMI